MVDLLLWLYRSDPAFAECPAVDLLERGESVEKILLQLLNILNLDADEVTLILLLQHFNRVGSLRDVAAVVILQTRRGVLGA